MGHLPGNWSAWLGPGAAGKGSAGQQGTSPAAYRCAVSRAYQIVERIPHSRNYQVTADGLSTALFFTRLTRRVIIPALADIAGAGPTADSPLRQADRRLQDSHRRPR